jgi:hypothetical protein
VKSTAIHGDRTQAEREEALKTFKYNSFVSLSFITFVFFGFFKYLEMEIYLF